MSLGVVRDAVRRPLVLGFGDEVRPGGRAPSLFE